LKHETPVRTRRQFLADMAATTAGAVLAAGGVSGAARREVILGGRRIRVVDGHAHCAVPEVLEVVQGTDLERAVTGSMSGPLVIRADRLRAMDEQGIDVEVLSVNPFWYAADRELARRIVAVQNRQLAALCAAHPDRFVALATVALQHPDLAVEQLQEAVAVHGLRGVAIGGSVQGEELSAPKFDPFWAKAEQLGILVFIHPQGMPEIRTRVQGNGFLSNVIGNPLETTIALSHLIFEGTLDRFPRLKICAAHGGGYLPSYSARSDHGCLAFPSNCTRALKKSPSEYLKQMHFDSLVFTAEGLRHLVAECGSSHVVLGTDYPFPWTSTAVDHVLGTPGLSDADKAAILGGNLAELLRIDPA
jgi:aminocarboxymuconate-semialdehyde decarboxylase